MPTVQSHSPAPLLRRPSLWARLGGGRVVRAARQRVHAVHAPAKSRPPTSEPMVPALAELRGCWRDACNGMHQEHGDQQDAHPVPGRPAPERAETPPGQSPQHSSSAQK
jgi:hypothetical protein